MAPYAAMTLKAKNLRQIYFQHSNINISGDALRPGMLVRKGAQLPMEVILK